VVPKEAVAKRLIPSERSYSPHKRYDCDLRSRMYEIPSSEAVCASKVFIKESVSMDQCSIRPPSVPINRFYSSIWNKKVGLL